jgi:peroxiredoxin (alkyl hydroperoxide reductase subunit C)
LHPAPPPAGPPPRRGDPAPEFTAVTTQGPINFPADYAGSWVILFSHPADFTPVCTSEFMTFATLEDKFAKANCKLVGLSVDGLYSHIAWLRTIKEKIEYRGMKHVEVTFPLIEDITMEVARRYGMIQPGESSTKAVRAVFFVDPKGIIRAIIYYPLSLGRNFDELYRALVAMQTADAFSVATRRTSASRKRRAGSPSFWKRANRHSHQHSRHPRRCARQSVRNNRAGLRKTR